MNYTVRNLIEELKKLNPNKKIVVEAPDGEEYRIKKISRMSIAAKIILY